MLFQENNLRRPLFGWNETKKKKTEKKKRTKIYNETMTWRWLEPVSVWSVARLFRWSLLFKMAIFRGPDYKRRNNISIFISDVAECVPELHKLFMRFLNTIWKAMIRSPLITWGGDKKNTTCCVWTAYFVPIISIRKGFRGCFGVNYV